MPVRADSSLVIVGGSLSGLTLALACANRGIGSVVIERAGERQNNGAALGIDRGLLLRTIGMPEHSCEKPCAFPVLTNHRNATAWSAVHGWLHCQADRCDGIKLIEGSAVQKIVQSPGEVLVFTGRGDRIAASVVVGADGYRSMIRAAISPKQPHAKYAGYLLWRGLVDEHELPARTMWPREEGVALVHTSGYRLVAYPVAGVDGSPRPGRRRISFAWYDPTRDYFLERAGCISRTRHVLASLGRKNVPDSVRTELRGQAQRIWPEPWSNFIIHALEHRGVFATLVAEYFPERLRRGRLAMIGDAAHVVSPMTGMGFVAGTVDAGVLAECLGRMNGWSFTDISLALSQYEGARLRPVQELARTSINWSRSYLENIDFRRVGQSWPRRPF